MIRVLLLGLFLLVTFAPGASASVQPVFFVIGDCVEYDTTSANPALRWRKATITEIDDYFITIEPERRDNDLPVRIPAGANASKWMRPAKGCTGRPDATTTPGGVPAPLPDVGDAPQAPPPAPPPAFAGRFKVDDCIEYDTTNRYRPELRWQRGRITDIDEFFVTIELEGVEPDPDMPTRVSSLQVAKWLRPAKGCAPLKKKQMVQVAGPRVMFASYQSGPAALPANVPPRPVAAIKCPVKQGKPGRQPDQAVAADVIRCLWQKDTDIESVRAHIDGMKVGQPRAWNPYDDLGNGKQGTSVFPIRTDWRLIRYYRSSIQMSENVSVFNCFINTFDEWECGLAQRIRDGSIQNFSRTR